MGVIRKKLQKSNYKVITTKVLYPFLLPILVITGVIFAANCGSRSEANAEPTPDLNVNTGELIGQADELFRQRDDPAKISEAIDALKRVRRADRRNYDAAWRLSRFYFYQAKSIKDDKAVDQAQNDGIEAGKIAMRIGSERPDGYFWMGANLGEKAKRNPVTGLSSIADIREAMNKVIALQPGYEGASAYDILAQIELQTDVIGGGSAAKAVEYLEKAIAIEKNNSNLYLHLGEAYLATDKNAEGKKQLERVLNMKPDPDHLVDHAAAMAEAKRVLENRF
jgi:tetratricopeptide (TPR) repeat protein